VRGGDRRSFQPISMGRSSQVILHHRGGRSP
jgi:hypothetical protein